MTGAQRDPDHPGAPDRAFDTRSCGSRGLTVSALGLGGAAIGHPVDGPNADESGAKTVELAYTGGIRHVDTSPAYGNSEQRVGLALRRNPFPGLTVSTKVGTHPQRRFSYRSSDIEWSLRNSLRLLGREYVDLALIHDPPDMEPVFAPGDGFDALHALREEGLCRNVGLGVRNLEFHRRAIAQGRVDVILTYGDFNIVRRGGLGLIRFARDHGVGVFLGSPLMHGLLASDAGPRAMLERKPRLRNWYDAEDFRVAQQWFEWCREREVSLRHLNTRFLIASGVADCLLIGAGNPEELSVTLHEATTPLPEGVWREALERVASLDGE